MAQPVCGSGIRVEEEQVGRPPLQLRATAGRRWGLGLGQRAPAASPHPPRGVGGGPSWPWLPPQAWPTAVWLHLGLWGLGARLGQWKQRPDSRVKPVPGRQAQGGGHRVLGGRRAQQVLRLLLSAARPPTAGSAVLSQAPHCSPHFQLLCGAWVQTSSWPNPFGCAP